MKAYADNGVRDLDWIQQEEAVEVENMKVRQLEDSRRKQEAWMTRRMVKQIVLDMINHTETWSIVGATVDWLLESAS